MNALAFNTALAAYRFAPLAKRTRKTVIVDIDGTLFDSRHRLHHVLEKPKNRPAFHAKHVDDKPIAAVAAMVRALGKSHQIVLLTGRPVTHYDNTVRQLDREGIPFD